MALSDRYNRGDGRLQALDRYLTTLGDRVGSAWWARTGIDRVTLTQGLFLFAAFAATQNYALTHNPLIIAIIVAAVLRWRGFAESRGGLVEQIQSEAAGLPKDTMAALRLVILGAGGLQLATAFGDLLATTAGADLLTVQTLEKLLLGSALVALQGGDYIQRTNPFTPKRGGHIRSW